MVPVRLTQIQLEDYKAFARTGPVALAPLTLVLGRNNSGKSALCRAPIFFTHCLRPEAWTPFALKAPGIDFGKRFLDVGFRRNPSGFTGRLRFQQDAEQTEIVIGATEDPDKRTLIISRMEISHPERPFTVPRPSTWEQVRTALRAYPSLALVPQQIRFLHGVRARPQRDYEYQGGMPPDVGAEGELAPLMLAQDNKSGDRRLLEGVNRWFTEQLSASLDIVEEAGNFALTVVSRGTAVNLADAGEGFGQVLPVAVALKALGQPLPGTPRPALYIIEQPELHLHPFAHPAVAELLIEVAMHPDSPWLLVETHSDNLVLRVRLAVAQQRLRPEQVRLYYIDDQTSAGHGSEIRPIHLDDRGTPDFWPKGVFAENLAEFRALQRTLVLRDAQHQG